MLTLRKEQILKMEQSRTEGFIKKLFAYLRTGFKERLSGASDKNVFELIETGITNSKKYHIETEIDVVKYVTLMLKHGNDFDQQEWANKILKNESVGAAEILKKLEAISEQTD